MTARPRTHDAQLAKLEDRIGYAFKNRSLLREALVHGSANDGARSKQRSYDRLEFLGDRVLGLIIADRLFSAHADEDEGDLAQRFNALVNRAACARAARAADLGAALLLSSSEEASGGRDKDAILADVCESVIAALYIDGGLEAARAFVAAYWGEAIDAQAAAPRDAKTMLQEWAAAKRRGLSYVLVERSGPEHAPRFVVDAHIEGFDPARGEGGSKREAQRAAAAAFLKARGVHG